MKQTLIFHFVFSILCNLIVVMPDCEADELTELLDMDLKDLLNIKIVTATRYDQDIINSPSVISVITREEIQRYGGNSLLDILRLIPGFVPVGDKSFGLHGATFRGDLNPSGEHILTLLDGQPFRSMQTAQDSTTALYRSFPISAIERIEVVHGPSSSIYGTNAVTGVINIITRKRLREIYHSNHDNSQFNLQYGSWNTLKKTFNYASQHNNWLLTMVVENQKTEGWPISEDKTNIPPGTPFSSTRNARRALHLNVEYKQYHFRSYLADVNSLFPAFGGESAKSGYRYLNFGVNNEYRQVKYAVDLGLLEVKNTLTGYERDRNYTMEANVNAHLTDSLDGLFGLSSARADNQADNLNINFHRINFAAYSQLSYTFNSHWSGLAGAQWNKREGFESQISPQLGLIRHINTYQGIKLLYNEAFRSPTASETDVQYYINLPAPTLIVSGNENLKPETVQTFDLQWFTYRKQRNLTIGGFYSRYHHRVYQRAFSAAYPGSPLTYLNGSTVTIWGFELIGKRQMRRRHQLTIGSTWQKNRAPSGSYDTTLAPRWTANLGYSYQFENGATTSILNQHVSEFGYNGSATRTNPASESYNMLSLNCHFPLFNVHPVFKHTQSTLTFYANNILDYSIWQPETSVSTSNTFQVEYGRSYYLTLALNW